MRTLFLAVLLCASAQGQILRQVMQSQPVVPGVTPGFVSAVSGSSTLASTLTTKTWDTSTCPSGDYCTHLAEPSFSGNAIFVRVLYKDSPSTTISVTDDKSGGSSTYTIIGTAVHDATNGYNMAVYYTANCAANIFNIFVNSTAAVAHVSVMTQQWYNLSSSPVRGSGGNAGANGSTTMSAGSITPTTGDLVLYWTCRTQTPAATSFTKGSQGGITWAKVTASSDIVDGCMSQWGIYTGSGAFTPQATTSAGSAYVAFAVALIPSTSGSAPTGMYLTGIEHLQIPAGTGTSTSYELPCAGTNAILLTNGGASRSISAVSSTPTLTWTAATPNNTDGNNTTRSWYAQNISTCTGDLTLAVTWSASIGDASLEAYLMNGAAASAFRYDNAQQGGSLTIANLNMFRLDPDLGGLTFLTAQPGMTNGLWFAYDIHNLNTGVGITNPSGGAFDAIAYGGQSLDGPSNGDQNNDWAHYRVSSAVMSDWTLSFGQSNEDPGAWAGELLSFMSATGSIVPRLIQSKTSTVSNTTTTATVALTPKGANHTFVVMGGINNTAAGVTGITLADTSADTVTTVDSMTTVTSYGKFATFVIKNVTNSAQTLTMTFTGTSSTHRKSLVVLEYDGVDQTTPVDVHTITNAAEDGSGNFCSGNVTNTVTNAVAVGLNFCNSTCSYPSGVGTGYSYGAEEATQNKVWAQWKILSSTGSINECTNDAGIGGNSGAALIVLKGGS